MAEYDTYLARADAAKARALAATTSPYTIEIRFLGGLTDTPSKPLSTRPRIAGPASSSAICPA